MEWSAESANHAAHHLHYRGRQVITLQGLETLSSPSVQLEDILYEAHRTNLELLPTLLRLLVMRGSQKLVQLGYNTVRDIHPFRSKQQNWDWSTGFI